MTHRLVRNKVKSHVLKAPHMQVSSYTELSQQKKNRKEKTFNKYYFLNREYDTRGDS